MICIGCVGQCALINLTLKFEFVQRSTKGCGRKCGALTGSNKDSTGEFEFMVDRNIVNKLGLSQEHLDQEVDKMFTEKENELLEEVLQTRVDSFLPGSIIKGTIVSQIGNDVIIEVGLKSEGVVDAAEFDSGEEIVPGKEIEVLLEDSDSAEQLIPLSKHKADRIRSWEILLETKSEGDTVNGKVIRRIKGGLLVDIGVPVFLPASQVDIRKPGDISRFIGKEIKSKVLKIDVENRNIVVSRRKLIEEERRSSKEKILEEIEVGQVRKGVVKNIADFGVFVDLGGLDGLLHISDLSWGRIAHPSEIVKLDEEIECVVIGVDKDHEKISLGLKQKTSSPWEKVEQTYPVGVRVKGRVVNVMNYGVFVRLEDGIEGLIHISEMSWTKRLNHPGEMLNLGDEIEAVVLSVGKEKQEISLGLKQTETNPWTIASQKYPPGTIVTATVRSVTNFGVFAEIEEGIDGMVHISDLSWTRKYSHPGEALQKGQQVKCVVLDVDEEKRRVSLGVKQMTEDPWIRAIPEKYIPGHIIKGKITKLTNFGAFVGLESELEGLLHISELADHKIKKPQDVVDVNDEVEVKILRVDTESRKIGLSLRRARWAAEEQTAQDDQQQEPAAGETAASADDTGESEKPEDKTAGDDQQQEPTAEEQTAQDDQQEPTAEKTVASADDTGEDSKPEDKTSGDDQQQESTAEEQTAQDDQQQQPTAGETAASADDTGEGAKPEDKTSKDDQQEPEAGEIVASADDTGEGTKPEDKTSKDDQQEPTADQTPASAGDADKKAEAKEKTAETGQDETELIESDQQSGEQNTVVPEAEADSVEEPEKGDESEKVETKQSDEGTQQATDNKAPNGSEATEDTDNK